MLRSCMRLGLFGLLLAMGGVSRAESRAESPAMRPTMYVQGRYLYDRCGEKTILRGFNAMIIYWDRHGKETYPEIAKTGANCCRIFWDTKGASPKDLEETLANCRAAKMIPIPCVWDATGKWQELTKCVDFWCRPEIAKVLKKQEDCLILNIANEAGTASVTNDQFREEYAKAIKRLREAGLRMPLMIDAANWGRGEKYLLDNAKHLLQKDPNLIFSWHPWDDRQPQSRYQKTIDASIEQDFCLVIAEFSHLDVFFKNPIDYKFILSYCQEKDIGWLPWVWWCGGKGEADGHSVTSDRKFGNWANPPWGEDVAIGSPYSIKNTAKRTRYMEQ